MALIGKIRKNSWLLVVLIGLGLGSFIWMDMSSGNQSVLGSQSTVMAEIEGNKIDVNEFNRKNDLIRNTLYRNGADNLALRNSLYNFLFEQTIVNKEAASVGIGVSKEEMDELMFGQTLSPIINSHFRNQTNGQINRDLLNQYKSYQDGTADWPDDNGQTRAWWRHERDEVAKDSKQTKLINLVSKSMYTPSWMAEMIGQNQNKRVDMALVRIPYDQIDNSNITITDADYDAYMKENGAQYKTTVETRKVSYVAFDVEPSAEDRTKALDLVTGWAEGLKTTDNDTTYVENKGYLDNKLFTQDELTGTLKDTIFNYAVGEVFGPFEEDNFFKAVKVLERKAIPDSVSARHILIKVDQNTATPEIMQNAYSLIDSLKTLLDEGADFATLATEFSEDASNAQKGGDLGYFAQGRMVGPFNDIAFFNLEEGEYDIVGTQFGFHIVKVTGQKFINDNQGVRLAYVAEPILPGEKTINALEDRVAEFIEANPNYESMQKAAADAGLTVEDVPSLKRSDYFFGSLGSGQVSRDLIRWAYGDDPSTEGGEMNSVSPEIYRYNTTITFGPQSHLYDNKYVVAALTGVQPAGIPSVEFIKSDIEDAVYNMKKAAFVQESMGTDLSSIAAKYNVKVDTLAGVNFGTTFLPAPISKSEPKVIAEAFNTSVNSISQAIDGTDGIYVLMPTGSSDTGTTVNIANVQRSQNQTAGSFARARLMQALKESADVNDNRATFF